MAPKRKRADSPANNKQPTHASSNSDSDTPLTQPIDLDSKSSNSASNATTTVSIIATTSAASGNISAASPALLQTAISRMQGFLDKPEEYSYLSHIFEGKHQAGRIGMHRSGSTAAIVPPSDRSSSTAASSPSDATIPDSSAFGSARAPSVSGPYVCNWEHYFMSMALGAALRSKDPITQVGCVLVDHKTSQILGVGYNGLMGGDDDKKLGNKRDKDSTVIHAEANALNFATVGPHHVNGAIAYVTLFPCKKCAQRLIDAGVTQVVYFSYRDENEHQDNRNESVESARLLKEANVLFCPFLGLRKQYQPGSYLRLNPLIHSFIMQVNLLEKLVKREQKYPRSAPWPENPPRPESEWKSPYVSPAKADQAAGGTAAATPASTKSPGKKLTLNG